MNNVEIKPSSIHGKGVFATEYIPIGTKFEFDVLIIPKTDVNDYLIKYSFPYNITFSCIVLGFATLINSSKANVNMKILSLDKINKKKTFITTKDINIGEELFLYYGKLN